MKYRTRINEQVEAVSESLREQGLPPLKMTDVSRGAKVPYSTLLRYANEEQEAPNFAIVDQVRRFLNRFLPKRRQFSDAGYLYPTEAEDEQGQQEGAATASV